MNNCSKSYIKAAIAAFGCASCFVVGFVMIFWIEPGINLDPHQRLRFILSHGGYFQLWYFTIFVAFASCLLVLANGLREWMGEPNSLQHHLAVMFGFIWSSYAFAIGLIAIFTIEYLLSLPQEQQTDVWYVIYGIQIGLGDGVEWVGGIWLATLSWVMLANKKGPKALHIFGLTIGLTGCLTLVPGLADAGVIFGLTQIVWFIWIGFYLLKNAKSPIAGISTNINADKG